MVTGVAQYAILLLYNGGEKGQKPRNGAGRVQLMTTLFVQRLSAKRNDSDNARDRKR